MPTFVIQKKGQLSSFTYICLCVLLLAYRNRVSNIEEVKRQDALSAAEIGRLHNLETLII